MRGTDRVVGSVVGSVLLLVSLSGCSALGSPEFVQSNGESLYPSVSYDGRYVAFASEATNLVTGDSNDVADIFVRDMQTGTTRRVSVGPRGAQGDLESTFGSIAGHAGHVVFTSSAINLVADDTNQRPDVFVHDLRDGTTIRVSVGPDGRQGDGVSYTYYPAISADGSVVAFASLADDLVPGDANGTWDVFVRDIAAGTTSLVSVSSEGSQGNGPSLHGVISGDGRYVAYQSQADNLVSDDGNELGDVFVHDRATGTTRRVSVDPAGGEMRGASERPAISFDGRVLAFASNVAEPSRGEPNGQQEVFVRELDARTSELVSIRAGGTEPVALDTGETICCILSTTCCVIIIIQDRKSVVSPDGQHVVYRSDAPDLIGGDRNFLTDIFVFDRAEGTTSRVSVGARGDEPNRESVHHGVSFDGRYVAFSTPATNLVPNDTNGLSDIFLRDREAGTTVLVSTPARGKPGLSY